MIALGCDHGGYELMQEVKKHLEERGLEYKDFGCNGPESVAVLHFVQIALLQRQQDFITMPTFWPWAVV